MVDASLLKGDHDMFVSGNDAGAKSQVTEILKGWFGWKHVLDLGDITAARGQEMFVIFWVRLYGALQTPTFNVHVVR
jgi:predicted dinucleotide-binding enzyme